LHDMLRFDTHDAASPASSVLHVFIELRLETVGQSIKIL